MIVTIAYYAVLLSALIYLSVKGGRTGRWGVGLLLATALLTLAIVSALPKIRDFAPYIIWVDLLSLFWKAGLALSSSRRWPIWVAAFQVNVMAAHVSVLLIPSWKGELYFAMITVWSLPTIFVMVLGTILDNRVSARR